MKVQNDILPLIHRLQMPQIKQKWYPDLFVWLGGRGVSIKAGKINPQLVFSHQEIDIDRAKLLTPEKLSSPVLLSNNPSVLDGDHRWYRHCLDKTDLPYIQLNLDFFAAIKLLEEYPNCYEIGGQKYSENEG